ncbi:MAG: hypothetical protein ACOYLB_09675 [Phototrophicaceae bacterium]
MRPILLGFLLFSVLVISACGGNASNPNPSNNPTDPLGEDFNPLDPFNLDSQEQNLDEPPGFQATLSALGIPTNPPPSESTVSPFGDIIPPGTVPPPGVLSFATEDPNADLIFDRIFLVRANAELQSRLELQLFQNGSLLVNGQPAPTVPIEKVLDIDAVLDAIQFFAINGIYASPLRAEDNFVYSITVERAGEANNIVAEPELAPVELLSLLNLIIELAP